jgi:hypothetical protein
MGCWGSATNSDQTSKDCTKAKKMIRAYCPNKYVVDRPYQKEKRKRKNWMIDPVLLFISFCSNQLSPIFLWGRADFYHLE